MFTECTMLRLSHQGAHTRCDPRFLPPAAVPCNNNPVDQPIPEDQLARIRPLVDKLLTDLRTLSGELTDEMDSALEYLPAGERE